MLNPKNAYRNKIIDASINEDIETLKKEFDNSCTETNRFAILYAAQKGKLKSLEFFEKYFPDPLHINFRDLLCMAASYGHEDCLEFIIKKSIHKPFNNQALFSCARKGYLNCIKKIEPFVNLKSCKSLALRMSSESGHFDCVKYLIPKSNPKSCNSIVLVRALKNNHFDVFNLLYPFCEPDKALKYAKDYFILDYSKLSFFEEKIKDENFKKIINKELQTLIEEKDDSKGKRKI